jgi:transposase InsO family protein
MTVDIKRVISSCKQCQRVKASGGHQQRDMQTESPEHFGMFHRWGLDHIVDLPVSANGFRHALVCIDYYSKWIEVIPVKDLTANTTVHAFLLNIIARFGAPAEIITDNGTAFKQEFRDFCRRRLIHQRFITEDVPRSNGLAERAVQTVKHALRKFAAQKHHALDWDTNGLAAILAGYRLTPKPHPSIPQHASYSRSIQSSTLLSISPVWARSITAKTIQKSSTPSSGSE